MKFHKKIFKKYINMKMIYKILKFKKYQMKKLNKILIKSNQS